MAGAVAFGCGQCLHCRINRSRQWKWRQYLEALSNKVGSCFVTLTYDENNIPADGSLEPVEVQLWLKRFRKALGEQKCRFYLCGEYGPQTYRPHYHVNLFGVNWLAVGDRSTTDVVAETWGKGFVSVREFNLERANYVTGYIVKHLKNRRDSRLDGKSVEFARMSRRPGLGADAMRTFARDLWEEETRSGVLSKVEGVPSQFRVDGKKVLLGRYLLRKLRSELGISDDYAKELADDVSFQRSVELCTVFAADDGLPSFAAAYLAMAEQALKNQAARSEIFQRRGNL